MLQIFKAGENVQAHPSKPIQRDLVKNTPNQITLSMELFKEMQTKCILRKFNVKYTSPIPNPCKK